MQPRRRVYQNERLHFIDKKTGFHYNLSYYYFFIIHVLAIHYTGKLNLYVYAYLSVLHCTHSI